jgi:hypothetical protein
MELKTSVVISTCQKYQEFWKPFFHFFHKFWSDCPYEVYLGTDFGNFDGVKTICGGHNNWATNMKNVLSQIPEESFVLLLEDFLLREKVDTERVKKYSTHLLENKIGCIRLFPCPGPDKPWALENELGEIIKGAEHRLSLQTAIWSKQVFMDLLVDGESIWNMEANGTHRTNKLNEPFLSTWRDRGMFSYVMGARHGKWTKEALEFCKNEGL